jgi:thiamine biosynthesis protein ThiS
MKPEEDTIEVLVNGRTARIKQGATIKEMLDQLALRSEYIAVELNRKIIKRAEWPIVQLNPTDQVEIVHLVGGGRGAPRMGSRFQVSSFRFPIGTARKPET